MKKSISQEITETQQYILFLEKAIASEHFKENDLSRYVETKEKLKKARFRLKCMKERL